MLAELLVVLWYTPTWDGNDWEMPQKKSKGCCRCRAELEIGRWTASAASTASRNATGVINDRSDLCCDSIWKASCHFPAMRPLRSRMPKLIWLGRKFCSNCLGQVSGCCVFGGIKHITKVCKFEVCVRWKAFQWARTANAWSAWLNEWNSKFANTFPLKICWINPD